MVSGVMLHVIRKAFIYLFHFKIFNIFVESNGQYYLAVWSSLCFKNRWRSTSYFCLDCCNMWGHFTWIFENTTSKERARILGFNRRDHFLGLPNSSKEPQNFGLFQNFTKNNNSCNVSLGTVLPFVSYNCYKDAWLRAQWHQVEIC